MPDKVLYTAEATSTGDGRNGHVVSSDNRLDLDLALPAEMGGSGNGTNPEQLFACSNPRFRRLRPGRPAETVAFPATDVPVMLRVP